MSQWADFSDAFQSGAFCANFETKSCDVSGINLRQAMRRMRSVISPGFYMGRIIISFFTTSAITEGVDVTSPMRFLIS